ncbi:uncharacterized protein LOC115726278 [Rhodamnia argentea]|uniref:RING-type E3 ubiquitin transferase n=1 Tax=Rhodamnia argentea TaxID=178133 RepID=A0A8B8MPP3_9MYRT|nr:uncharacterized protein LOC115726278 [Rhodamnia argentea]
MATKLGSLGPTWVFTLLCIFLSMNTSPSWHATAKQISYSDHCTATVPEAAPNVYKLGSLPLSRYTGYYVDGRQLQGPSSSSASNSFSFLVSGVYKTDHDGVLKVEADLRFRKSSFEFYAEGGYMYGQTYMGTTPLRAANVSPRTRSPIIFRLEGFWSESSGKLCMVGPSFSTRGHSLDLDVVLKLDNVSNSANVTSLFTGVLESLSPSDDKNYFDAMSILMFPQRNYKYSLVPGKLNNGKSDLSPGLAPRSGSFCWVFDNLGRELNLIYAPDCSPVQNCTPIRGPSGYLPPAMSVQGIGCSRGELKMRVLLRFSNKSDFGYYGQFDPNLTLVGEAMWDEKNRLQIKACRINVAGSFSTARVEDCSVRVELMFPGEWSIRERYGISGHIWSEKSRNESGYFTDIVLRSTESSLWEFPDLKYEYTETERVRKLCPGKKDPKSGRERYPNPYSPDMRFDMLVKNAEGKIGAGYSYPLFVDDQMYERYGFDMPVSRLNTETFATRQKTSTVDSHSTSSSDARFNISYHIGFMGLQHVKGKSQNDVLNRSWSSNDRVEISAEGVYDAETGDLCMVGCKSVVPAAAKPANMSQDCEVLIRVQFPPLNSKRRQDRIVGTIESMRDRSDPLHFDRQNLTSVAPYVEEARRSIWRLDLEVCLVLASNTFLCIFIGIQILHMKRQPEVLPYLSIAMLVILTLGHAIPLVLNFEALFLGNRKRQNISLGSGRWLEINEVLVRVATMIAFLMQFRLLQLTWAARKEDGVGAGLWFQEKKALIVSLVLYAIGALAAIIFGWRSHFDNAAIDPEFAGFTSDGQGFSIWGGLKRYAGLIVDGFLLPQILLNVFRNSSERALSGSFYLGTTLVRLLPHGYDLYRARNYSPQLYGSYIYGTPGGDFYSTAWDVIIPLGGLVFAAIIFLQQRFCGAFIVPKRFRTSVAYQKVPVAGDGQT